MKYSPNRSQTLYETLQNSGNVEEKFERIIKNCKKNNIKYEDQDFYPQINMTELDKKKLGEHEWRRIEDQYPNLYDNISPKAIQQGCLGDCYFIVSLIYASHYKNLVKSLFHPKSSLKYGCVLVYFYFLGEKLPVIIDTQVAYRSKNSINPLFSHPRTNDDSCWFVLVEKAFAKACGSYSSIESGITSFAIHVLFDFYSTSFTDMIDIIPAKSLEDENKRNQNQNTNEVIFNILLELKNKNAMIGTGIPSSVEVNENVGLISSHAYYILDLRKSDDKMFIKLRNPWGKGEYKGAYSIGSKNWTEKLKNDLDYQEEDDGSFWMLLENYFYYFKDISYSLPKLNNWKETSVCGIIDGYLDGRSPCVNSPNIGCIPQWSIKFSEKTVVRLTYDVAGPESYHGLYICKNHGQKVDILDVKTEIMRSNTNSFVNGIEYIVEDFSEPFTFFLTRNKSAKQPCYFRILIQSPDINYTVKKFNDNYFGENWYYASDSGIFSYKNLDEWNPFDNKPLSTCQQWHVNFPDLNKNEETELRFSIFKNISSLPIFLVIARTDQRISYMFKGMSYEIKKAFPESTYEEFSIPINNKFLNNDGNKTSFDYVFSIYQYESKTLVRFKFHVLSKRKFIFNVMPQPDPKKHCGYTIYKQLLPGQYDGLKPYGNSIEKLKQWCLIFKKSPTNLFVEFLSNESLTHHYVYLERKENPGDKIGKFMQGSIHFDFHIDQNCIHDQIIWKIEDISKPYAFCVTRNPPIQEKSGFTLNIFGSEEFDMFEINGNSIGNKVSNFVHQKYYYYTKEKENIDFPEISFIEQPINFAPKKSNANSKINTNQTKSSLEYDDDNSNQNIMIKNESQNINDNINNLDNIQTKNSNKSQEERSDTKIFNKVDTNIEKNCYKLKNDSYTNSDNNEELNNNKKLDNATINDSINRDRNDFINEKNSESNEESNNNIEIEINDTTIENSSDSKIIQQNKSDSSIDINIDKLSSESQSSNKNANDEIDDKNLSSTISENSENDQNQHNEEECQNENISKPHKNKKEAQELDESGSNTISNKLLDNAKLYLKKRKLIFTEIALIWNLENNSEKNYVFILSLYYIIILKQKKHSKKLTKELKQSFVDLSSISLLNNEIIKIKFKKSHNVKRPTLFFQAENPKSLINSINNHIQRILTSKEIKSINYEKISKPKSLLIGTSHSILCRFNSLISANKIEIPNDLQCKISQILFSHSKKITLSKIKKIKKIFPLFSSCISMNKFVNQIYILDTECIIPLILQNIEYFDNIKHVEIKGLITENLQKLIEQSKNIHALSFTDCKINKTNLILQLIENNLIDSLGFDQSLDTKSFQSFIQNPIFSKLKYFRVSNINNLNFSSAITYFKNISILSFKSCNLQVGNVLKYISSNQLIYLKELDLSENIGTGFDSDQITFPDQLISLYVNKIEWEIGNLISFLNLCCCSNLSTLSINNITFYNPNKQVEKSKKKNQVQNLFFDYDFNCWKSLFENIPFKMNSLKVLNWNFNSINSKFVTFLMNSKQLNEVSFCGCHCNNLSFVKSLLLNTHIQSVNLQNIVFSDVYSYFNNFKEFLANIHSMKSLKQIDLSHNKFNNECFDILSESLINSSIKFIAFDDSNISSFDDLFLFYKKLLKLKELPIHISYPILDIQRLKLNQDRIDNLNKCFIQLRKLIKERKNLYFSVFPEVHYLNLNKEFPQFTSKENTINIIRTKQNNMLSNNEDESYSNIIPNSDSNSNSNSDTDSDSMYK